MILGIRVHKHRWESVKIFFVIIIFFLCIGASIHKFSISADLNQGDDGDDRKIMISSLFNGFHFFFPSIRFREKSKTAKRP